MKAEGSPSEVGLAHAASDAASPDTHQEDHFSDDEPETELEALQHLPPEERRKALRRLRNRESARRVRARRLAEMSQMGNTLQGLQDENTALKAHVNKLQSHVQSMTLKVYEVTAKYESALAEVAQLRAELLHCKRTSAPGDSSFIAPGAHITGATAAAANGPNSAPLNQISPFVAPMEMAGCQNQGLSAGHVHLRSSSPMDLQSQREALEEVVMLLKEHKRRNRGPDRSGCSEIASSGAGGNNLASNHSPTSDTAMPGPAASQHPMSNLAASGLGTNNSSNNGVPYNANTNNLSRLGANEGLGVPQLTGGRSSQSEVLTGSMPQYAPSQLQQQMSARVAAGEVCPSDLSNVAHLLGQWQPRPHQMPGQTASLTQHQPSLLTSSPSSCYSLPPSSQQQQQQLQQLQLPQAAQSQSQGQSHSHPLAQLQMPYQQHQFPMTGQPLQQQAQQQQQLQQLQQAQQLMNQASGQQGAAAMYGNMSSLSLSAPLYTLGSGTQGTAAAAAAAAAGMQIGPSCHGPNTMVGGGMNGTSNADAMAAAAARAISCFGGAGGGQQHHHRSASYALDRGAVLTGAQNAVAVHPSWQGNLAAGVALLRPEDITEDIFMSLDEYVPQDL